MANDGEQQPITIAQAWSAPIVICALGVGYAIWGMRMRPEAEGVTATLVILFTGAATATALIARGIVGFYRRRYWQGAAALIFGMLLFVSLAVGMNLLPDGEPGQQW